MSNISTLVGRPANKKSGVKGKSYQQDLFQVPPLDMNYNHGYAGMPAGAGDYGQGYGPPAGGYEQGPMQYNGYGQPSYSQGGYDYDPSYGGAGGMPPQAQGYGPGQGPPYQGQDPGIPMPMYQEEPQFIRRDPHRPDVPRPNPPSSYAPQPPRIEPERIPRNPDHAVPLQHQQEQSQPYDPYLPTYDNAPIPMTQRTPIVAPSINSIFEIAAERVSKQAQQQRHGPAEPEFHRQAEPQYSAPRSSASGFMSSMETSQPQPLASSAYNESSVSQAQTTEMITGAVTQMQDMFGMVGGEVFFQTSTVVGPMPAVGDKVVVEAERVSGMPFKFNGKRVQILSKDLNSSDGDAREESSAFKRRQDFGPLPTLPDSLNLGQGQSQQFRPLQQLQQQPQLKSILKRNAPPPPTISETKKAEMREKYRPESPVGFPSTGGSFSLDLRGDFPVIKQPAKSAVSSIQDLYPELLYVRENKEEEAGKDKEKSKSSKRRSRSRSSSESRSSRRRRSRSSSRSRRRRRSRSRSRKRSRSSSRSRDRKRRSRSKSRSKERRKRRGTPEGMKKTRNPPITTGTKKDDDEVTFLDTRPRVINLGEFARNNPFGGEAEIKAVIEPSTLLPRMKRRNNNDNGVNSFGATNAAELSIPMANKPVRPSVAPIKFQIGNAAPPPTSTPSGKLVPNPAFSHTNSATMDNPNMVQNPNFNPSALVASVEKAIHDAHGKKKKKTVEQEPAFKIKGQNSTGNGPSKVPRSSLEGLDDEQARRIKALKDSLQAQKLAQLQAQEQLLNEERKKLQVAMGMEKAVENKLKGLRQNFEQNVQAFSLPQAQQQKQQGTSWIEVQKVQEAVEYQKFLEEEKRLKTMGDILGLQRLYVLEDRRRRRVEEEKLERLRLEEIALKNEGNWEGFQELMETWGPSAEREMHLMQLKERRRQEEMEEEREAERLVAQRESNPVPRGRVDESPPRRRSRSRSRERRRRSRSRSRNRERRGSRSPVHRRPRSRSKERRRDRGREEEEREAQILAQMEAMRRHEEELMMREREISDRMHMMQGPPQDRFYREEEEARRHPPPQDVRYVERIPRY